MGYEPQGISVVELARDDNSHFTKRSAINIFSGVFKRKYGAGKKQVYNTVRWQLPRFTRPLQFRTNYTSKKDISFLILNDINESNDVKKHC